MHQQRAQERRGTVGDAFCRIGGRPSHFLEMIRGPQADLLLFAGVSPTPEALHALRVLEESVVLLQDHVRVRYMFPSQAYASDAGMSEDDPKVIVDGLENLHAIFGIERPEIVYVRPDGYIGLPWKTWMHDCYSTTSN